MSNRLTVKNEEFVYHAKTLVKQGFLSVYPYRRVKQFPPLPHNLEDQLDIVISSEEHHTTPPDLWTEGQLIREMSRLNIGTDATRAQHIATVIDRGFARVQSGTRMLIPTEIGLTFYQMFTQFSEELILPQIRETVEKWTTGIRTGETSPREVDTNVIDLTKDSITKLRKEKDVIFTHFAESIRKSTKEGEIFGPCGQCHSRLVLKSTAKGKRYLECSNKHSYVVPKNGELTLLPEKCHACDLYPLQVGSGTKSWLFCPHCWTNRKDEEGLLFCSRCEYTSCPYSKVNRDFNKKQERGRLGTCPNCLAGDILFHTESFRTIIECNNCSTQWQSPNIRAGTSIQIDGLCKLCGRSTLLIKRKGKSPYNMCPVCSLMCFQCVHRCFG